MKRTLVLVCTLALLFVAACSKDSPVAAPTPTVSSITVTSAESMVVMGNTVQMTASSTLSNGTTTVPACSWTTDTPGVATVSASGLVTGVGAGAANIICTSGGREGHKLLR